MTLRLFLAASVIAAFACCGNQLPDAQITNVVDTVTLGAIQGAALTVPSAFDITVNQPIRTDQSSSFDFIYNVDSLGRHVFLPLQAIGLATASTANPGLQKVTTTFSATTTSPSDGYSTTDTLVINVGDVIVARSRVACYLAVPQYAKLHILSFDDVAKTMQMEVLSDTNCGYRDLAPGTPLN